MDFAHIALFSALKTKMSYASERQGVLAQNVANADVPGYKAKDVASPNFESMAKSMMQGPGGNLQMTATNGKHLMGNAAQVNYKIENRNATYEQTPNGSNVSIDEEMMRVSQNQAEYQKSLNLYQKMVSMFNTAAGKAGSSS